MHISLDAIRQLKKVSMAPLETVIDPKEDIISSLA
jgi:hypothetical protein